MELNNYTGVLYFTASWCQPCKKVRPIVTELVSEGIGNFYIIDVDHEIDLAKQYQIKSIPTFIFLGDGEEIARTTGAKTKEQLKEFIANNEKDSGQNV